MLNPRSLLAVCLLVASTQRPAAAQQFDAEAMSRWGSADSLRYHVVGIYQAPASIASDGSGQADVVDRVEIDFGWKLSEMKLIGTPAFQNTKSTVTNLRDREPTCLPPILKGEYEHYDLLGIKEGLAGALQLQWRTDYPAAQVAQFCTASRKEVPAKRAVTTEEMAVPSPVMLAMPLPDSGELRKSADQKSLVLKKGGWTWTFTPSIAK